MSDSPVYNRRHFLGAAAMAFVAAQLGLAGCASTRPTNPLPLAIEGRMPSLDGATSWLNSIPLTTQGLHGRVILVNFWTYSCINWRRTLPYLRAWETKYKDQGLIVIGVHTPEFDFERNPTNVQWAVTDMRIDYPVAIDTNHTIWRGFENHSWPAFFLIDPEGHIRYHHFGEGNYVQLELILQQLLRENGKDGSDSVVTVSPLPIEVGSDWSNNKSPETYLGSDRITNFASIGGASSHSFKYPSHLAPNEWALAGNWTIGKQATTLNEANGRIAYRFHARDLHLVMGPTNLDKQVRFRVLIDGQLSTTAHGVDVDNLGNGTVIEPRMYHLIRQQQPIREHQFEIEFLDAGVNTYSFTFG